MQRDIDLLDTLRTDLAELTALHARPSSCSTYETWLRGSPWWRISCCIPRRGRTFP
jgi:hypothetical protein